MEYFTQRKAMLEEIKTTLEAEWPVIAGAPILILVLMVIAMIVAWRLRGGLARDQLGALEDRLRFAADRFETAAAEKADLEKAIGRLERDIFEVQDAKHRISLCAQSAAVQSHIRKFADLWTQIGMSLGPTGHHNSPPKHRKKK